MCLFSCLSLGFDWMLTEFIIFIMYCIRATITFRKVINHMFFPSYFYLTLSTVTKITLIYFGFLNHLRVFALLGGLDDFDASGSSFLDFRALGLV